MPARLISLDDQHVLLLDKPILLIGRHEECDVQLESRKVSRRHCCIAQVDNYLVVRDLESTNGLRINGTPVLEGQLRDGDELTIGNLRYKLEWEHPPAAAKLAQKASRQPKVTSRVPPEPGSPVSAENLVSCDIPVPLKDPEGWRQAINDWEKHHQANGTERAHEEGGPSKAPSQKKRTEFHQGAARPGDSSSEKEVPNDRRS